MSRLFSPWKTSLVDWVWDVGSGGFRRPLWGWGRLVGLCLKAMALIGDGDVWQEARGVCLCVGVLTGTVGVSRAYRAEASACITKCQ